MLHPDTILVLALVLVAGWLFGLASHPGGKKWRDLYAAERDAHAAHRRAAEQKYAADKARIADLERENARLAHAAHAAPVARATIARPAATPAYTAGEKCGWFDWEARPTRV